MAGRPVFHEEIGRFLTGLREARGWSQGQTVVRTKGHIKLGTLKSLEAGRIKHPDARDLAALASVYGISYGELALRFVEANYGLGANRDLIRHTGGEESANPIGGADDPASARILELERQVAQYETQIREVRTLTAKLVEVATRGGEVADAARVATGRRRPHRKVAG